MVDFTPEEYAAIIAEDQLSFTEEVFAQVSPAAVYKPNWHVECIVEHLKALEDGEIKRLIVNMPPRAMKSITINIAFPAWLLGRDPRTQIISASYARKLGVELNSKTADVMLSDVYRQAFPDTQLAKNTEDWFKTSMQGHRFVATTGSAVTGFGGDYIIIDDPLNPEEAFSEVLREKANRWVTNTLLPRANDPDTVKMVCVMQRLHENDVTGMLQQAGGWHELILPAEFHKKQMIEVRGQTWTCEEGEYLHPERLTPDALAKYRNDMGEYGYAGQYLQSPVPVGGGEFKPQYVQYYNQLSKKFTAQGMNVYILVDPANEKKKKRTSDPDYTAMIVVGLAPDNNYYILDIVRDRLNPTERINKLIDLHMKWSELSGIPPKVGYEKYGMMTDVFYLKKAQDALNYRFPLVELGGTALSKEDRIRKIIPEFENGRVYLPRNILYTTVNGEQVDLVHSLVEDEMLTFPVGKHDDMLDALARIVDEKLYARFPKIQVHYLERGQSIRDDILDGFDEDNFMSW